VLLHLSRRSCAIRIALFCPRPHPWTAALCFSSLTVADPFAARRNLDTRLALARCSSSHKSFCRASMPCVNLSCPPLSSQQPSPFWCRETFWFCPTSFLRLALVSPTKSRRAWRQRGGEVLGTGSLKRLAPNTSGKPDLFYTNFRSFRTTKTLTVVF
jgi:hypothetical protein